MADKTFTQAEVNALLAKATGLSDLESIAARPYQLIKSPDGTVLYTPGDGSPHTLNGEHPDDYYGAGADGIATKRV